MTELDVQRRALENTGRQKDEFLGMLAHELRNPLAAISNAAALVRLRLGRGLDVEGPLAVLNQQRPVARRPAIGRRTRVELPSRLKSDATGHAGHEREHQVARGGALGSSDAKREYRGRYPVHKQGAVLGWQWMRCDAEQDGPARWSSAGSWTRWVREVVWERGALRETAMFKVTWGDGEYRSLDTAADVDRFLLELWNALADAPSLVEIEREDTGDALSVGVGRGRSVLDYVSGSKEPPYYTTKGELESPEAITFQYGGQASEFPMSSSVSADAARQVVSEFCSTGALSTAVAWQTC